MKLQRILVGFASLLALFISAHVAFAATAAPADGVFDCSDLYRTDSVQVAVTGPAAVISGTEQKLSVVATDLNHFPIVDGSVYIKVYHLDEAGNGALVDQFYAAKGMNIAAGSSEKASFVWQVPAYALSGDYQMVPYFVSQGRFELLGSMNDDAVHGIPYGFTLKGDSDTGVAFTSPLSIVSPRAAGTSTPVTIEGNGPVTVQATLENTTSELQTVSVVAHVYRIDAANPANELESIPVAVTLSSGEKKPVSFTISDQTPETYVTVEALYHDAKSIVDTTFDRAGSSYPRIEFASLSSYPITAGMPVTYFACVDPVGISASSTPVKIELGLTGANGQTVDSYAADVSLGSGVAVRRTFTPSQSLGDAMVSARVYRGAALVDAAVLSYGCSALDPQACTGGGLSNMDWSYIAIALGFLGLAIMLILSMRKKNAKAAVTTVAIMLALGAAGFTPSKADAATSTCSAPVQYCFTVSAGMNNSQDMKSACNIAADYTLDMDQTYNCGTDKASCYRARMYYAAKIDTDACLDVGAEAPFSYAVDPNSGECVGEQYSWGRYTFVGPVVNCDKLPAPSECPAAGVSSNTSSTNTSSSCTTTPPPTSKPIGVPSLGGPSTLQTGQSGAFIISGGAALPGDQLGYQVAYTDKGTTPSDSDYGATLNSVAFASENWIESAYAASGVTVNKSWSTTGDKVVWARTVDTTVSQYSAPASLNVTVTAPPAVVQYTLSVQVSGQGTVKSDVGGIDCSATGGTCSASFQKNSAVTLSATPASGSSFSGWSGPCSGTGSCSVTVNGPTSVAATFSAPPPVVSPSGLSTSLSLSSTHLSTGQSAIATGIANGSGPRYFGLEARYSTDGSNYQPWQNWGIWCQNDPNCPSGVPMTETPRFGAAGTYELRTYAAGADMVAVHSALVYVSVTTPAPTVTNNGNTGPGANAGANSNSGTNVAPAPSPSFNISLDPSTVYAQSVSGFSGAIQQEVHVSVNPVSGFDSPVTITVDQGSIPSGIKPEFSFDGGATWSTNPKGQLAWDGSNYYRNSAGLVYLPVRIRFDGVLKPNQIYPITFDGTGGTGTAQATLSVNSKPVAPNFQER